MLGAGSDPILPSGQWLDPDTWTRTGGRFSIGPDLSLDANEGDVFCMDGRDVNGIVDTHTNLVSTVLDDNVAWTVSNGTRGTVTDLGDGLYRFDIIGTGAVLWDASFASASLDRIGSMQARVVSGVAASAAGDFAGYRLGASAEGTAYNWGGLTSEFQDISFSVTSADATDTAVLRFEGTSTWSLEVQCMRAVDGTKKAAAFPDGSGIGTSYGADLATVTAPAWPATGRTLTVSRRNYTTGVISSVSTTPAPTAGNYVLDGSTDGNYTYLSRVSNNILTAGQIADQEAVMETILAATPEFCPNWVLVDSEPVYVNGIPIEVV